MDQNSTAGANQQSESGKPGIPVGGEVHDPRAGFHDIKPLPQFSPIPAPLLGLTGILALAALVFVLLKLLRRKGPEASVEEQPADEELVAELTRLDTRRKQGEIDTRALGTGLSLAVRRYLERELKFPAMEQTTSEVEQHLPGVLAQSLPTVPKQRTAAHRELLVSILRRCEQMTFGPESERELAPKSDGVDRLVADARRASEELAQWVRSEKRRQTSVIAHDAQPATAHAGSQ